MTSIDGGDNTPACGTPGAFQSGFDAADSDRFFAYEDGLYMGATLDGTVTLTAPAADFEGVYTDYGVKLADRAVTVELPKPLDGNGTARFLVVGGNGIGAGFEFVRLGPTHQVGGFIGGVFAPKIPFEIDAHRFLRIRDEGGTVFMEVAAVRNGTYTALHSGPFAPGPTVLMAFETRPNGATNGGEIGFDNLNTELVEAEWCVPSDFSDDFGDGLRHSNWIRVSNSTNNRCFDIVEEDSAGNARFDQLMGVGFARCLQRTRGGYDLTKGPVSMEATMINAPNGVNWRGFIRVAGPAGAITRISYLGGRICADGTGLPSECIDYLPGQHRFFQISMPDATTVDYSVSADGITWIPFATGTAPFDGKLIKVAIGSESESLVEDQSFLVQGYN